MRILLIEDDTLLADGLARALRHSAYVVDIADNGLTADSWLSKENYDLAILDLGLPGLDGSEVLSRLRARRQRTLYWCSRPAWPSRNGFECLIWEQMIIL